MLAPVMRHLLSLILYTSLALGANGAFADYRGIEHMRDGSMKKLIFADAQVPTVAFEDENGGQMTLHDFKGKWVLVNFWATWCAPCRKEMPTLSELQTKVGNDKFQVITIATGRNSPTAMRNFFESISVENLPLYNDPKQSLARSMNVLGLPLTVLINPQGVEVARLRGDANWSEPKAISMFRAVRDLP